MCAGGTIACARPQLELAPREVSQIGGEELRLRGDFAGHGGVVVLIDEVPAHAAVLDAPDRLRVRVPPLPRTGMVDLELVFADGEHMQLSDVLRVTAPPLEIRASNSD
jgi:hypothetical protein